ncbi:hypothetical protein HRR83_006759 [Exophiala dermatitidis]|uniref:Uncharacterized protein n=1 Tax=Exophiala dermatitidis TaxID=5970 RepID=A0AAN6ITH5_EXODE|nr:hypothetical protein HRR74_005920 [Exophiala dermatitidis]KAJ4515257.1 hypothetical protein HRR73_005087 [Exophiala dermatitidis]KAJ4535340.1 hypothetical protein HRR77_007958 [Exophiala dermatitidis]KAJ4540780.1 hypothetical protein HRR76_004165 [Exophiala dermatitidis]KAJ4556959.1 hypothetical protein HRR79_008764 [Exophiala dermatitidis]
MQSLILCPSWGNEISFLSPTTLHVALRLCKTRDAPLHDWTVLTTIWHGMVALQTPTPPLKCVVAVPFCPKLLHVQNEELECEGVIHALRRAPQPCKRTNESVLEDQVHNLLNARAGQRRHLSHTGRLGLNPERTDPCKGLAGRHFLETTMNTILAMSFTSMKPKRPARDMELRPPRRHYG